MSNDNSGVTTTSATSIESAIAGEYNFSVGEVITESWQKTKGLKGPFWAAAGIVFLIILVAGFALSAIFGLLGLSNVGQIGGVGTFTQVLFQLTIMALIYPFMAGIVMLGVRRSVDLPISWQEVFAYFSYALPLVGAAILMSLFIALGFALVVIPGIYLSIAYMMTVPLIVEKNLGVWEAMETSRKAVTRHWFKLFFVLLLMGVIVMLSIIPFGLGLIWTYPMLIAVLGILYREIFGVEQTH